MIPIEEKDIDAVISRRRDLPLHHLRVRLILVSPERHLGLLVPRKAGLRGLDQFPLGPSPALLSLVPAIPWVVIAEIVNCHGEIFFSSLGLGGRRSWTAGSNHLIHASKRSGRFCDSLAINQHHSAEIQTALDGLGRASFSVLELPGGNTEDAPELPGKVVAVVETTLHRCLGDAFVARLQDAGAFRDPKPL